MDRNEVKPQQLEFSYSTDIFSRFRAQAATDESFIGQPRALRALKMGMSLFAKNYNIFLSGDPGSGRHEAVRYTASLLPPPPAGELHDIVFAYNFDRPRSPLTLVFPAGEGREFSLEMEAVATAPAGERGQKLRRVMERSMPPQAEIFCARALEELRRTASDEADDRLRVNCAFCAAGQRPLVFESHPTQTNLFGQVSGGSGYVHLSLCLGSVIDATDGFLVIDAQQLLNDPELWDNLRKFLDFGTLLIKQTVGESESLIIKPTAFRPNVKIILIGTDASYDKLCELDEGFLDLFNVSAEFDFSMPANEQNIISTVGYLDRCVRKDNLIPLSDPAVARALFYSSAYAELRGELTTKLSFLSDLVREASYWASESGRDLIQPEDIDRAVRMREWMNSLTESKINEEITNGEMIISLSGTKTGVINGLAVMDRGNASFGTPTVISVSVAPGTEGIVNIEHEAGLSGEIHDKGLLILEGYLRKHYARTFPLSMYAGICFEQSYAEVDGDSASSAELFALLSAIGDIPLRQEIAVTGSVNQLGDIQPVGGINEKISGYFRICKLTGLSGRQGVIIPRKNLNSLLLGDEILEAVRSGKFHIYAIDTIDQGMEILTNRPSGQRNSKGNFPPDTLNNIIENHLKNLCNLSRPAN